MLMDAANFKGFTIAATDGSVGAVTDFLFDDVSWAIRWIVVDTGNWLSGRNLLMPVSVLGQPDPVARSFPVALSMAKVEASPGLDAHQPVSRQHEAHLYGFYGTSPYWANGLAPVGPTSWSAGLSQSHPAVAKSDQDALLVARHQNHDPHLRSIQAVTGYFLQAKDGSVGHVEGFLIDAQDWTIHFLRVDTKNWWPGKHVLIPPRAAKTIQWAQRVIHLDTDRQTVMDSPAYARSVTLDAAFQARLARHYDPGAKDASA